MIQRLCQSDPSFTTMEETGYQCELGKHAGVIRQRILNRNLSILLFPYPITYRLQLI